MPEVRTIFQPDTTIDVSDDDYEVLKANGLLAPDPAPATKTRAADQPPATPPVTTTGAPTPAADTTTKKG